jgi:hypothetical protein
MEMEVPILMGSLEVWEYLQAHILRWPPLPWEPLGESTHTRTSPHNICTHSTLDVTHTWGSIPQKLSDQILNQCIGSSVWAEPTMSSLKWRENIILRFNVKISIMKFLRSHFGSQLWTNVDAQEVGIFLHTISLFKYYSKSISAFLNIFGYLLRWGAL